MADAVLRLGRSPLSQFPHENSAKDLQRLCEAGGRGQAPTPAAGLGIKGCSPSKWWVGGSLLSSLLPYHTPGIMSSQARASLPPSSPVPSDPAVARSQYREMRKALLTLLRKYSRRKEEIARAQEQVLALRRVINRQSVLLKDASQKISELERLQELHCEQYRTQLSEFVRGYDLQSKSPL
jgi:hypothetical protein